MVKLVQLVCSEAASDLGAGPDPNRSLPLPCLCPKTGIIAGSMLVFVPAVGEFVIPELVGGSENLMIGKVLWQEFFDQNNWPLASAAVAVIMVALLVVPIALFQHYETGRIGKKEANMPKTKLSWFLKLMLLLAGIPLYSASVFWSFILSMNPNWFTVWGGFSTKWYGAMMEKRHHLEVAWLSLRIAIVSSLAAVALGTLAGYAMARIKRFPRQHPVCRYDFRRLWYCLM